MHKCISRTLAASRESWAWRRLLAISEREFSAIHLPRRHLGRWRESEWERGGPPLAINVVWLGSARAHDHSCRPPAPEVVGLKRHSGEWSITFNSVEVGTPGRTARSDNAEDCWFSGGRGVYFVRHSERAKLIVQLSTSQRITTLPSREDWR